MRQELSSVDIRVLVRELKDRVVGCGVDKAYQVGSREIVLKLYGRGTSDLVAAPNFLCLSKYRRPAPKVPSSFVMQLRKHLGGQVIREFAQHGFDRIVELHFENHILIFELFSRGNVIFCTKDMRIIGLLEWQKWKDRVLGVGKTYEYPPSVLDPFEAGEKTFREVMSSSGRGLASTLATRLGLGGIYAEQVCASAGVDVKADFADIDGGALWMAFRAFLDRVDGPVEARLSEDNVSPFGGAGEPQPSFNDAVDEYFSRLEESKASDVVDTKAEDRRVKTAEILRKQEEAYERAKVLARDERIKGDLIYQRMGELNALLAAVRDGRKRGLPDEEILKSVEGFGLAKGVKGFTLTVEL